MLLERRAALGGRRAIAAFENAIAMWCSRCQQDVPAAFAPGAKGKATCARCGHGANLAGPATHGPAAPTAAKSVAAASHKSPIDLSDWKLEDDLREAQRLVRLIQLQSDEPAFSGDAIAETADTADERSSSRHRAEPVPRESALLGWLVLGCGLSGLVCGCALLAWSHFSQRSDLWNIGLPIAVVSQVALMCGILLQQISSGGQAAAQVVSEEFVPAPATHLHVNSGGGMHASGLSVHFSTTPQQSSAPSSRQIKQQVEAAMRRRAA